MYFYFFAQNENQSNLVETVYYYWTTCCYERQRGPANDVSRGPSSSVRVRVNVPAVTFRRRSAAISPQHPTERRPLTRIVGPRCLTPCVNSDGHKLFILSLTVTKFPTKKQ